MPLLRKSGLPLLRTCSTFTSGLLRKSAKSGENFCKIPVWWGTGKVKVTFPKCATPLIVWTRGPIALRRLDLVFYTKNISIFSEKKRIIIEEEVDINYSALNIQ